MKNKNNLLLFGVRFSNKGFTLIELLLTMAIIAILAGAILVSLSSQRQKANQSKLLAELSGVIQPMLMCRSDNESIDSPNGSAAPGNICQGESSYGTWPATAGTGFGSYTSPNDAGMNDGVWFFHIQDTDARICCNSKSSRCKVLTPAGAACTDATDLTN